MKLNFVERFLNRFFANLGTLVAVHPWKTIFLSLLVCLAFASGLSRLNFRIKTYDLLVPYNARSLKEADQIDHLFSTNVSYNFDFGRATSLKRFARVILSTIDGADILNASHFRNIAKMNQLISNISVHFQGRTYSYGEICARKNGRCFENDILYLEPHIPDYEDGNYAIKYPMMYDERTVKIYFLPLFLGGVEVFDGSFVRSAKAISLMYILDYDNPKNDELNDAWEEEFLRVISKVQLPELRMTYFTSESIIKEGEKNILYVIPYFLAVVVVLIGFSIATSTMRDCTKSKPWLGLFGALVGAMGVMGAFGLCQYLGITCFAFNIAVALIMLGIAFDDTYVLMAAWRRSDPRQDVPTRMRQTYERAGMAITLTSLTNLITFLIGAMAPLAFSYIFCIYAMYSVLFCYVVTITFFGAILALFGRVEQRGLNGFDCRTPAIHKSLAKDKSLFHRWFCVGGPDPNQPANAKELPEEDDNMWMIFFRDYFAKYVYSKWGIWCIIVTYLFYIGFALYGITFFQMGIQEKDMADDNSYVSFFWDDYYNFFKRYTVRGQLVINEPLDYSDAGVQHQIESILQVLENSPHVANSTMTESWLRQYLLFQRSLDLVFWYRGYNVTRKDHFISFLSDVFLQIPGFKRFQDDIVFNENRTEIVASRFLLQVEKLPSANHGIKIVRWIRDVVDRLPFEAFVYNPLIPLVDHVIMLENLTVQSVIIATIVMMIVAFLFIPKMEAVVLMSFTIISIQVGLVGFMGLWGIWLNTVTMVIIIVSVGFCIDTTAHIVCAFNESKRETIYDRMSDALYYIGFPVTQGYITTLVGASALAFSGTDLKVTLFKVLFLVLTFAYFHGLFILPLILIMKNSLCGEKLGMKNGDGSFPEGAPPHGPKSKISLHKSKFLRYFLLHTAPPENDFPNKV